MARKDTPEHDALDRPVRVENRERDIKEIALPEAEDAPAASILLGSQDDRHVDGALPCEVEVPADLWARAEQLPSVRALIETRAIEAR